MDVGMGGVSGRRREEKRRKGGRGERENGPFDLSAGIVRRHSDELLVSD
jgi:hypothetical protein